MSRFSETCLVSNHLSDSSNHLRAMVPWMTKKLSISPLFAPLRASKKDAVPPLVREFRRESVIGNIYSSSQKWLWGTVVWPIFYLMMRLLVSEGLGLWVVRTRVALKIVSNIKVLTVDSSCLRQNPNFFTLLIRLLSCSMFQPSVRPEVA